MARVLKQYVDWWTNTKNFRVYPVIKGGVEKYMAICYDAEGQRAKLCYTQFEATEFFMKTEWKIMNL
jgi:hypothetical protein